MFGKKLVTDMITRSAENETDRRRFLRSAGLAGLGVVGASVVPSLGGVANAATPEAAISDGAILNFALNLEYLEAQFYSHAVHGTGLSNNLLTGTGRRGTVTGGHAVPFTSKNVRQYAEEIANDELHHVEDLRAGLGSAAVSQPSIDLKSSFTAAATAAGLIKKGQSFDPFANENNFLLGAFIFEDVGVTAYKGAAPLISNKTYLSVAAGILAVEAYHASLIRTQCFERGLSNEANAISNARDSLDGPRSDDQFVRRNGKANIIPTAKNGIVYSRTAPKVLNVVYLTPKAATKGGFFPEGMNGTIYSSENT